MHNNIDLISVARQGLVYGVIDNLLCQVIRASGIGIHTGALAHRLKPRQYLDGVCVILGHYVGLPYFNAVYGALVAAAPNDNPRKSAGVGSLHQKCE